MARAAYFPTVSIGGDAGFQSTQGSAWLSWSSRIWSVGPSISETIYDGGLRRATVEQYRAQYDQTVANYRNTVLTSFQQVEDNLSSLRILSQEVHEQDLAVDAAHRGLTLATDRYRLGIDPYLNVITAQTTLLSNQQTALNLRIQQIVSSVQLVEALGGGWDAKTLATGHQIITRSDVPNTPTPNKNAASDADDRAKTVAPQSYPYKPPAPPVQTPDKIPPPPDVPPSEMRPAPQGKPVYPSTAPPATTPQPNPNPQ